jgi:hypothetical protein
MMHNGKQDSDSTRRMNLTVNNISYEDPTAIADIFNNYFTSIGSLLAKQFPISSSTHRSFLPPMNPNSISFFPTDNLEIYNIINNLEDSATCGQDEIPITIIKNVAKEISLPLSLIINHSMEKAIFPDKLKIAKIIPLFRNGEKLILLIIGRFLY